MAIIPGTSSTSKYPAPDGGFGWLVVLGAFLVHIIVDGMTFSLGEFLPILVDKFNVSEGSAVWVQSTFLGVSFCCGPFCSILDSRVGHRWTSFIGSMLATIGLVFAVFATELWHVVMSFGIIMGIGYGMTFFASIVAVSDWFDRRKSLAMGVAVCGAGIGAFIFNPFTDALLAQIGWGGCMGTLAGIAAASGTIALLFRDVPKPTHSTTDLETSSDYSRLEDDISSPTNSSQMEVFSIEEPRKLVAVVKETGFFATLFQLFNFEIFKNWQFIVFLASTFLVANSYYVPYNLLEKRVTDELGVSHAKASWLPSILGIAGIFGRLSSGLLSFERIKKFGLITTPLVVLALTDMSDGTTGALSALCYSYTGFTFYAIFVGFCDGLIAALNPIVSYNIAGDRLFLSAWGYQMFAQGAGTLVGPVVAGSLSDYFGKHWQAFVTFGVVMVCGGLTLLSVPLFERFRPSRRR